MKDFFEARNRTRGFLVSQSLAEYRVRRSEEDDDHVLRLQRYGLVAPSARID